jgi:hypothetical protein
LVGITAAFHSTAAPRKKPEPLIDIENAGPPAVTEGQLTAETVGVGRVIAKFAALEDAPLGFTTVTLAYPGLAMKSAGTEALN